MERASSSSLDTGHGILLKALRAGNRTLTHSMLQGINRAREARGLVKVQVPHGCHLHSILESRARALDVLAEVRRFDKARGL